MPRRTHPARPIELVCWLLPAVVIAFGLGSPGEATASEVAPAHAPAIDADEHAQYCKCRHCRGESCCCGPRRAKPTAPRADAEPEPARPVTGPCMGAAPCDDAGLPDAPVTGPSGKVASLPSFGHPTAPTAGRLAPPDGRCTLPSRRASRFDEPPERLALA